MAQVFTQEQVERIFKDAMDLTTKEMTEVSPARVTALQIQEGTDLQDKEIIALAYKLADQVVEE